MNPLRHPPLLPLRWRTSWAIIFVALLGSVTLGFTSLHAAENATENLIRNPGFEAADGSSHWHLNNWAKLQAKFSVVTTRPHSGRHCLKMDLAELSKGANIQLMHSLNGKLKAGNNLKIGFWLRGHDNTPPVKITLNQYRAPWKTFFESPVQVTSSWKYYEFFVLLKDDMDFDAISLTLFLSTENTVWVDDFSAEIAPTRQGGVPLQGNQVLNHSFEVGREKWYFHVSPQGWAPANQRVRLENQMPSHRAPAVVPITDAPHGDQALRMEVAEGTRGIVNSAYFDLRYGHQATLEFDVKTSHKWSQVYASVGTSGEPDRRTTFGQYFKNNGPGWHHHEFTFTPTPSLKNRYCFELFVDVAGEYLIDNVRVSEGDDPGNRPLKRANIGWELTDAKLSEARIPGNLYAKGDLIRLRVLAEGTANVQLRETIVDVYDRVIGKNQFEISLKDNGKGERMVRLPTKKYGAFKYIVEYADASSTEGAIAMEWQYQVLPPLKPLHEVKDRFFGGHSPLTPMALEVSRKVGLRSLRMHPPLNTKWSVVEPQPNEWDFETSRKGLQKAREMGFDFLGSLDSTPEHRAAFPTSKPAKNWMHYGNHPPQDWSAYEEYVKRSVIAFKGLIDHWEVWNEPDNDFLAAPVIESIHGKSKEELYFRIVQHTQKVLDENNLHVNLVVGAVATLDNAFTHQIIDQNITQHGDVFSFHMYGGTLSPDRLKIVRRAQGKMNRKGNPATVWHSEGAYFPTIATWLRTPRIPEAQPEIAGHMVNKTVIRLVELKAAGVQRSYHYPAPFHHSTGRKIYDNRWSCGWDCAGNPLPIWAGHAACVRVLEGARPDGKYVTEHQVKGVTVHVARFLKGKMTIRVVWASSDIRLSQTGSLGLRAKLAFDVMSNPIKLTPETVISESPLYLVSPK